MRSCFARCSALLEPRPPLTPHRLPPGLSSASVSHPTGKVSFEGPQPGHEMSVPAAERRNGAQVFVSDLKIQLRLLHISLEPSLHRLRAPALRRLRSL